MAVGRQSRVRAWVPALLAVTVGLGLPLWTAPAAAAQLVTAGVQSGSLVGATPIAQVQNTALAWGQNSSSWEALGTGTAVDTPAPTPVVSSGALAGKHITSISTDYWTSCAVASGQAFCWGQDVGTTQGFSATPVAVDTSGAIHGLTATGISVGDNHVCGIFSGRAFCWGLSLFGALGTSTLPTGGPDSIEQSTPIAVDTDGLLAGKTVETISAGGSTTCVLADGKPYCWGSNAEGQLGNNAAEELDSSYPDSDVPVAVDTSHALAGLTVTAIATGGSTTCALASENVFCWGSNGAGALGIGDFPPVSSTSDPVAVKTSGVLHGKTITDLSVSSGTVCVLADGEPYCWGANGSGGLGVGTSLNSSIGYEPVAVPTTGALAGKKATAISAGNGHSCVLAAGAVYCWGSNVWGEMGLGFLGGAYYPPEPVLANGALAGRTITGIAVGHTHSFAITAEPPGPAAPGTLGVVPAARLVDSRPGKVPAGGSIAVQVTGRSGVPTVGVGAVVVNVTAVNPAAAGYLAAGADGAVRPATSTVNFGAHQTAANLAVVPVGADGKIRIYNGSAGPAGVIIDISGYYLAGAPAAPGALGVVPAARLVDSRPNVVAVGGSMAVQVTGRSGVPTVGVGAVVVNVTAVNPAAAGYLAAGADGAVRPATSTVNFGAHQTAANLAVVPVGADGKIRIYNGSAGPAGVIIDISGYYLAGAPAAPGALGVVPAARLVDSRPNVVAVGGSMAVQVTGRSGVPTAGVGAVVVNVTAVNPATAGYLAAGADGAVRPATSTVNFGAHQTAANLAVVPVGADGNIRIYNGSAGPAGVIIDISGYYLAGT